jgi:hypothetical protein
VWLIEALCYKPEGRGFVSIRSLDSLSGLNSYSRLMAVVYTQPLTKPSTWSLPGGN